MPSFKVLFKGVEMILFKGVEMIKNHCSEYSIAIELFIATKAMLTLNCVSVRYYWGPHLELEIPTDCRAGAILFVLMHQPRGFDSRS